MNYKRVLKAFALAFAILFLLGYVYPTVTAEITQNVMPYQSEGSPVVINGTIYGSYLLANSFNGSYFFHPRPSSNSVYPIGSNYTLNQTQQYLSQFEAENPTVNISEIPYAMIAYSASGQDPNIPVLGAYDQVARIVSSIQQAGSNVSVNISSSELTNTLNNLINQSEQRNFPIFGSYYVDTVYLNVWIINYMESMKIMPEVSAS